MSKRSLFWGQASGKLGEAVYYRSGGEQRTRTYVGKIKNPKTYAQMVNRLPMANLVAVYRALRPWLKGAFENKPARRSDFNEFFALNKSRLSYVQTKGDAALGLFVPNDLKLSRGTISLPVQVSYNTNEDGDNIPLITGLMPGTIGIDYIANTELSPNRALTGQDIYRLMTANGNPNMLPSRFKVTFIVFAYGVNLPDNADGEAWTSGVISADCYEGSTATLFAVGRLAPYMLSIRPFGDVSSDSLQTITAVTPYFDAALRQGTGLQVACIVSYTQNGKQYVTTSEVVPSEDAIRLAQPFKRNGSVWEAALNEYGYTPDTALSTAAAVLTPATSVPDAPSGGGNSNPDGD